MVYSTLWDEWEQIFDGSSSIDSGEFLHFFEDPGEYELSRSMRHFADRDLLRDRAGHYLFDRVVDLEQSEVLELAADYRAELARLARLLGMDEHAAEVETAEIDLGVHVRHARSSSGTTCDQIHERLAGALTSSRAEITVASHLWQAFYGLYSNPLVADYLTEPLVGFETRLAPFAAIAKTGRSIWVEDGLLGVSACPAWPDARPGWDEVERWPSELTISLHMEQERRAIADNASDAELAALQHADSPFARWVVLQRSQGVDPHHFRHYRRPG